MQVETRAPAPADAKRSAPATWSAPLLVNGIISPASLHDPLWSESAERQEARIEGLKDDEERVADVLEGLGPTSAQQGAQMRAVRDEAREAATARAPRPHAGHPANRTSRGEFRYALESARGAPGNSRLAEPAPDGDSVAARGSSPPASMNAGSYDAANAATSAPTRSGNAGVTPEPGVHAESPRPAAPGPVPTETTAGTVAARMATLPIAPGVSAAGASAPRAESISPAAPAGPAGGVFTVASGVGAASESKSASGAAAKGPSAAERDADQSKQDADDRAENVERVLRVLRGSLGRERTTTVIRLDPPELGALRLELDLRKDVLMLRMSAESDAAQRLLRDELETLRGGLEAAGIRLERVEIAPLAPVQEAAYLGAFGDATQRQGESGRETGDELPRQFPTRHEDRNLHDERPEPPLATADFMGPARLNVVA